MYSRFSRWNRKIDSSCSISFWGKSCFSWLLLLFKEFSVYGKCYAKILAKKFSPLFHLHCHRQVASIFTFILDLSVKLSLFKNLCSVETKIILVTVPVLKLQQTVLYGTREVVLLVHCIVPTVPNSPQNPKVIWIIKLLKTQRPKTWCHLQM